jgi:hypothetical protein
MKSIRFILLLAAIVASALLISPLITQANAAEYVGVAKCKMCHSTKALGGIQYKLWEQTKHAKAMDALKAAGEAENPKCLKCHTTGYGQPAVAGADLNNVQCEACHGAGSNYRSMKIMNKKAFKENKAAAQKRAIEAGLIFPPTEEVCVKCHNKESPNFKGFDFATYKEKIKHWK